MTKQPVSFIADSNLLREDYKVDTTIDILSIIEDFKFKLENFKGNSIIGLVGPFGSGKSTMLHQVSQKIQKDKWIQFDAWQFPNRGELWEGFVIEFSKNIDETTHNDAKKIIKGTKNSDKRALIDTLGGIPGVAAVKGLNHFFTTLPATRTVEIQEILKNIIENKCDNQIIYIVVEDIDRSGDAGVFFLETLKYFLNTLDSNVNIKVIVPIADKNYLTYEESYLKCLDIVEFFPTHSIKLSGFINSLLSTEIKKNPLEVTQIKDYLEELLKEPGMTIRKIKLMLRKADLNYIKQTEDGHEPDWRMTIMFETAKYISSDQAKGYSYFDTFRKNSSVPGGSIFSMLMEAVAANRSLKDQNGKTKSSGNGFRLIKRTSSIVNHPSAPYITEDFFRTGGESSHFCMDYYLNY